MRVVINAGWRFAPGRRGMIHNYALDIAGVEMGNEVPDRPALLGNQRKAAEMKAAASGGGISPCSGISSLQASQPPIEGVVGASVLRLHADGGGFQEVASVERIDQFAFYEMSKLLHRLAGISGEVAPSQVLFDVMQAIATMQSLIDGKPLPISVSKEKAKAVKGALDRIANEHFYKADENGDRKFMFPDHDAPAVHPYMWHYLNSELKEFETVLKEEMRETATYYVPRRGIFHIPALVDSAEETFPAEIRGHIPAKTIADWQSAGRCLAFNLLSASGFHVARAVEGTMEAYYFAHSGKSAELPSWNEYIKALEAIAAVQPAPDPCPREKTMSELRRMKDDYRNPIMHPRVVLSEADARVLFANGESVIIAMAQEIKDIRERGGVQPSLIPVAGPFAIGSDER